MNNNIPKDQRSARLAHNLKIQAQCKTALGLLDAAMLLMDRATTEAPMAGINGSCVAINRHIGVLQRELLRTHDGAKP